MSQLNLNELAEKLDRIGYRGLLRSSSCVEPIDDPWYTPDAPQSMLELATDERWPWRTRFLAAEAIFIREMFLLRAEHYASLALVYARALAGNVTGSMADWGFLAGMDDAGRIGSRFVHFGHHADPALRPLLNDPREAPYSYPPEFPSRIRTDLRIKDFAALYLSRIHNIPITLTDDPAQRDGEIDRLKMLL